MSNAARTGLSIWRGCKAAIRNRLTPNMIENYYKGKPKGPFNREVRIIAGFSNNEIDWLEGRLHD